MVDEKESTADRKSTSGKKLPARYQSPTKEQLPAEHQSPAGKRPPTARQLPAGKRPPGHRYDAEKRPLSDDDEALPTVDRTRGAIYGICIAKALGAVARWSPKTEKVYKIRGKKVRCEEFPSVTDFGPIRGHPSILAGTWFENSSMIFCLMEAVCDVQPVDLDHNVYINKYNVIFRWYDWFSNLQWSALQNYESSDPELARDTMELPMTIWIDEIEKHGDRWRIDVDLDYIKDAIAYKPLTDFPRP